MQPSWSLTPHLPRHARLRWLLDGSIIARFYKHKFKRGQSTRFTLHPYDLNALCRRFPFNFHYSGVLFIPTTKALVFFAKVLDLFRRLVQDTAVFFPRGVAFFVAGDFSSPSSQFLDDSVGHWMPLAVAASF
jgi:hypothetical protein